MKLVIVESPTKAKTLSGILGKEYLIKASMGHIRDLPKSKLGVDTDNNFRPEYVIPPKAKKVILELKKNAKLAEIIVLATDPDREGEAIAWHISEVLEDKKAKKKKPVERVVFHELTKDAVTKAFSHAASLNMNLVDAQQARRVLDRLVGYKLSPLLWKKVRYGLSAGRVQSVAIRLVVERERERQAFTSEEYWSLEGEFEDGEKQTFFAAFVEKDGKKTKIKSQEDAKHIQTEAKKGKYKVLEIVKSERQRRPYAPFKTSTLQQAAANLFGFSAKRTMDAAQKLFENGHITYHRTDSLSLSLQFTSDARFFVTNKFGKAYIPEKPIFYKTSQKNAQEAHEAIRPTDVNKIMTDGGKSDEAKIYSLVWKRSLECQMVPAIYDLTLVNILSDNGYGFRANGSVVKFDGWLAVGKLLGFNTDAEDTKYLPAQAGLPELKVGSALELKKLESEQHFTQPPARYSDATLIKALEDLEIGRPSTYAPTIQTIQARGYVTKENRYFVPEDVAFVVTDLLVEHFSEVVDYKFTADLEKKLDEIANGGVKWVPVIKEFYEPFDKDIREKEDLLVKSDITTLAQSNELCPKCGKALNVKLGKYGKFLSCSGFPDCDYAKPIDGEGTVDFGKCDKCDDGKMLLKQGRFGKFLACSNYPKCKNTKTYLDKVGVKCPDCGDGDVVVKKSKKRVFYGCSRYPDCKYSSWKSPK